jgi:hypothetical protein
VTGTMPESLILVAWITCGFEIPKLRLGLGTGCKPEHGPPLIFHLPVTLYETHGRCSFGVLGRQTTATRLVSVPLHHTDTYLMVGSHRSLSVTGIRRCRTRDL